jgi:hypothetical protein
MPKNKLAPTIVLSFIVLFVVGSLGIGLWTVRDDLGTPLTPIERSLASGVLDAEDFR